jgi:hypothetical protein
MCISQYKTKPYNVSFEIFDQNIYLKFSNIKIWNFFVIEN